jgi:5-methylcytosine-specific restriction protein A
MFTVDQSYTKKQIYQILEVPDERRNGNWDTGYRQYEGDFYIFANIGIPGRTGHDYTNYWDGDLLHWEAKAGTHPGMPSIQQMLSGDPAQRIYVFTRTNDMDPFTYEGIARVDSFTGERPVKVVWRFDDDLNYLNTAPETPGQVFPGRFWEGGMVKVLVNKYERDRGARRECIKHFGPICQVCEMDFEKRYGSLGQGFIHVHHIVPVSLITREYLVDPVNDLIPVCPNCHCMLHKKSPAYAVAELKKLIINIIDKS